MTTTACNQHRHADTCPGDHPLTGGPVHAEIGGTDLLAPEPAPYAPPLLVSSEPVPFGSIQWVEDSGGDGSDITAGVIDDDATFLYTNGQCFALAIELSARTGWPVQLELFQEGDPNRLDPEHEDYDEYADPDEIYANIIHAYVRRPDGMLIDIRGVNDPEIVAEDRDAIYGGLEPQLIDRDDLYEATLHWEGFLARQDYPTAAAFVDPVLNKAALDELDPHDRRLLHNALIAHVDDNHAGGVMGWSAADHARAAELFDALEHHPETLGFTDSGRTALLGALVYPVHDTDHALLDDDANDAAEAMLHVLAEEFGR